MKVPSEQSRPLQYANAIAKSDLSSGVRATCWALATFADKDSGEAWPSVQTLAKTADLFESVVSNHTGTAESHGYLSEIRCTNTPIM